MGLPLAVGVASCEGDFVSSGELTAQWARPSCWLLTGSMTDPRGSNIGAVAAHSCAWESNARHGRAPWE